MGQSLYAPAATLGELAYLANTLVRSTNSTTPFEEGARLWDSTLGTMTARLLESAANNTDDYSKRSLLLRYTVYAFMRQWPLLPSSELAQLYDRAEEVHLCAQCTLLMDGLPLRT